MTEANQEVGRIRVGEPVGAEHIIERLRRLEQTHTHLREELEANQREYERLAEAERDLLTEHDRLRRKLRGYDEEAAA